MGIMTRNEIIAKLRTEKLDGVNALHLVQLICEAAEMLEEDDAKLASAEKEIAQLLSCINIVERQRDYAVDRVEQYMQQDVRQGDEPCHICSRATGTACENCDPVFHVQETAMCERADLDGTEETPLTLEQLRKMEDQPVWVHVIDHTAFKDPNDAFDSWGLCRKSWVRVWDSKRADLILINYDFEDYGKMWVAYAYPPVKRSED